MEHAPANDLALRIGLSAKALGEIDLTWFIQLLNDEVGNPLNEKRLRRLNPKKLFQMLKPSHPDITRSQSNHAFAILTSETVTPMAAPEVTNTTPLGGPKLQIAISSNSEEMLDGHFGSCLRMLVFEVNETEHRLAEVRTVNTTENGLARTDYLTDLIRDCDLLATLSIGGPAAAKVTRADIHPIKHSKPVDSVEVLTRLKEVIGGTPPKWLQKKIDARGV